MARENLPTNYVNYELATAMGGMRRFNQINNSDGTISFEDATTYSVTGTTYGASEINTANALINEINELVGTTSISGSGQTDITSLLGGTDITNATLGLGDGTVTGAISELTSNLNNSWATLSGVTASPSYLTGLVVKYRTIGSLKQFLVYATGATTTGYVTLSSTQLATIISNAYSNMGLPDSVAIGYSSGYTVGYLQNSNILLKIETTSHYQSSLLTF